MGHNGGVMDKAAKRMELEVGPAEKAQKRADKLACEACNERLL